MLVLAPVPPSLAPGGWALTENLPNVFAFCLLQAEALREESSSRGKESRLSSRQRPWLILPLLMVCALAFWRSDSRVLRVL